MHARAYDAEELPSYITPHRQALVRREDADFVNLPGLHVDRRGIWVQVGLVPNVPVTRGVWVLYRPHCTALVEVIREEDAYIRVECYIIAPAP